MANSDTSPSSGLSESRQFDRTDDKSQQFDPDEGFVDTRSRRQARLEFALLCLCNIAWTIDAALLPYFFKEFQVLFRVSQTSLSMLSTVKGWTAAIFAFPCGFMSEMLPRPQLVGLGMMFWACGLALCGMAASFEMLFAGRMLNGVGLGIVQPLLYSMVADKNPPSKRGTAFGALFFAGQVCQTLFGFFATKYAAQSLFGFPGWRWSIAFVVVLSALVGLLIVLTVEEPNAPFLAERRKQHSCCSVIIQNMPKVFSLFRYPTFVLILIQGAPGTAPWTVFPFFTQWLELSCFTHNETATILAAFTWGCACSNLVSGALLNFVARRFPDHGPPTIANISVASGVPFLILLFFVLPKPEALDDGGKELLLYLITFVVFGLGAAMCGVLNKKVFGDIAPAPILTYIYAVDQLIENTLGNFAGLAVGLVTDHVFKYNADAVEDGACAPEEARKLGLGMFWVCNVGWAICFTVYLFMHLTYPKDRRRQMALRREDSTVRKAKAREDNAEVGEVSGSQ